MAVAERDTISGHGGSGLTVGPDGLRGLFLAPLHDSVYNTAVMMQSNRKVDEEKKREKKKSDA